jgi:hypothetical protein
MGRPSLEKSSEGLLLFGWGVKRRVGNPALLEFLEV